MATRTKTREPLPLVTEESLLNEAMECPTDRSLETNPLAEERAFAFWQKDIPEEYWGRGAAPPRSPAPRGVAFKRPRGPAERPEAEFIVFCGVHFMAESADILSQPHQKVVLPNMSAGCSMADMADPEDVYACWDELAEAAEFM